MITKEFNIAAANINDFNKEVEKLNKALTRNHLETVNVVFGDDSYDLQSDLMRKNVTVTYPEITNFKGDVQYFFQGTVEKVDGNLQYHAINCDEELLRGATLRCECCGKEITSRTKSIVMSTKENADASKDLKFFGTICARNYFTINFEQIFNFFENFVKTVSELGEEYNGEQDGDQRGRSKVVSLDDLLDAVCDATSDFNDKYKSADNYGSSCTKEDVIDLLIKRSRY